MKNNAIIAALLLLAAVAAAHAAQNPAPIATPEGITLEPLGQAQGYDLGKQTASILLRDQITLADSRGLTLYTYEKDPPDRSTCVAECEASWRPAIALPHAQAYGDWSLIRRPDGSRQWAYKRKALYTFVKDFDPGSVGGNDPANLGARRKNLAGEFVGGGVRGSLRDGATNKASLPPEWKPALIYPVSDVALPPGIVVREVADAQGLVLTDSRGHTLYAFDGDPRNDAKACAMTPCPWQPAEAPEAAGSIGEFAGVVRPMDGIKQWTFRGRGLYTYAGDLAVDDAYGIGVNPKWDVAALVRYYVPASVTLVNTPGQGKILATADGKTLYRRDAYILQSGGGHSLRRGNPARPAVGRDIGVNAHCDGACAQHWHPFLAPASAQPRGFWSVDTRSDGSKQWVYQGFALWTYDGDKKPGDMNDNDNLYYEFDGEASTSKTAPPQALDVGTPQDGTPALYWAIMAP